MPTKRNKTLAEISVPLPEVEYNDKILDAIQIALDVRTRCLTFEGTIRSAKTVTSIQIFHLLVQRMRGKYALIAAENYDAIRTNLLQAERGLMTLYPDKYRFVKEEIGGFYVEASTKNGIKEILLCGYADSSKWEKILGKDIEIVLIDEVNIADKQFVDETFARQGATEHPVTIFTLNGDDPQHLVYQERINKSLIVGNCPASTKAEMDNQRTKKRGYLYMWWSFDDNPKLTNEQKRELRHEFPVGSYYHKTKILGERGKWGILIFADYMENSLIQNCFVYDGKNKRIDYSKLDPKFNICKFTMGVDIAEGKASNVFMLTGFDRTYGRAFVLDRLIFKSRDDMGRPVGFKKKTELLRMFLAKHADKKLDFISVDSAEGNYINDLRGENLGVQIIGSYKSTIKQRIDLLIILFNKHRITIDPQCADVYAAYQSSTWAKGKEGIEREDSGAQANDIMDALEYSLTTYMTALTTASNSRGEGARA